jgi:hypothetical protein
MSISPEASGFPLSPEDLKDAGGMLGEIAPGFAGKGTRELTLADPCEKSEDGKHVDDGGMFYFQCRNCGVAEDYSGGV